MRTPALGTGKRRVGRPRKRSDAPSGVAPKAQILDVAARLFAERGIAEVSMMEVAEAAGLGQSSLYYWFRRKELIVAELLQQVNRVPLAFAKKLEAQAESPALQLYRLVRFDVHYVCAFPLEITEVHRFSQRDPSAFEVYWRERAELTQALKSLVERGIRSNCFLEVDAYLTAITIIAQDESVQNWNYRRATTSSSGVRAIPGPEYGATEIAEFVATRTVASLLVDPALLEGLKQHTPDDPG